MIRLLMLISFVAFAGLQLQAQRLLVELKGVSGVDLEYPKFINDSVAGNQLADRLVQDLQAAAYLEAQVDTSFRKGGRFIIQLNQGNQYEWVQLKAGNLKDFEVSAIDLNGRLYMNRPFNQNQLQRLFKRCIRYFEDHGYPFASIRLDSIVIDQNRKISATLNVEKDQYYRIDSLKIEGKTKLNPTFLKAYLRIQEGQPYNERTIKEISTRMSEIPFLREKRPHEVRFFEEGVTIVVYPEKKKASRFDGILGLLTDENTGKIDFTGDIDLLLINSFNRGERIGFNWRKLKGNSQDLQIDISYPYIFQSQFGIDYYFKLFKRDTTFLDITNRLGVNYAKSSRESFQFFYERKSSRLLSRNNLNSAGISQLALGDVAIDLFGIGYNFQNFNYLYNPRKGVGLNIDFGVGRKRLEKINALEEENPNLYDDVQLNTNQYSGKLKFQYFIPFSNRTTLMIGNQSATVYSENLYQNELLRFGGLKVLRGFDEEALTASTYSIGTLELRFLLDRNSYFALFSDAGYYEVNTVAENRNDTPLGLGAGINFETKAGIFSFNYAYGRQQGNPFDLRAAKIHFGFINIF